ncbi:MAG: glycosyltransferase [Desulfomicrobium apsheronum]|nr:glycosyltransferase [Desulfomicrobium apsheronum]
MRILFTHVNFPAQFRNLASLLGRDPGNEVVFATQEERPEWNIPGVRKVVYVPERPEQAPEQALMRRFRNTEKKAEAALRAMLQLRAQGFVPDVIYGHSGWGSTMFLQDVFPEAAFMGYFEWFYGADSADMRFSGKPLSLEARTEVRVNNLPILADLAACDQGICPTRWQLEQFPAEFRSKISVIHDGLDTNYFSPDAASRMVLPGLDLSGASEIVTYATRGMEPYRGFPQFLEAAVEVVRKRPECHVVIGGSDRSCYGAPPAPGKTWKEVLVERLRPDPERIHFVGVLPYAHYLTLLQASSVHVYLTRPFVLSWSFLEALSCGCLVVASDTEPVREVATDGHNVLMTDFRSPQAIAARIIEALENRSHLRNVREEARRTVVNGYDLRKLLPLQVDTLRKTVEKRGIKISSL